MKAQSLGDRGPQSGGVFCRRQLPSTPLLVPRGARVFVLLIRGRAGRTRQAAPASLRVDPRHSCFAGADCRVRTTRAAARLARRVRLRTAESVLIRRRARRTRQAAPARVDRRHSCFAGADYRVRTSRLVSAAAEGNGRRPVCAPSSLRDRPMRSPQC